MRTSQFIKSIFITFFDGCYNTEPSSDVPSTFSMGITKLEFDPKENTLTIHLRRPGLLIGKKGVTIRKLENHLNCHIKIIEVHLQKD